MRPSPARSSRSTILGTQYLLVTNRVGVRCAAPFAPSGRLVLAPRLVAPPGAGAPRRQAGLVRPADQRAVAAGGSGGRPGRTRAQSRAVLGGAP